MIFLFVLSCSSNSEETYTPAFWNDTHPIQPLDTNIEIQVQELISLGLPHPLRILDMYNFFMEQRSSSCPSLENPNAQNWMGVWDDDCSTPEGNHYYGTALYGSDMISDEYIDVWLFNILCSFELTDPQGETFVGGGEIEYKRERENGNTYLEARVNGSFSYPPADDWLSKDSHSSLFISGSIQDDLLYMSLYGGFSAHNTAIFFDQLALFEADCGYTLSGKMEIRDSSGYWRKAEFFPCSPCASQSWMEEAQEDLCIGEAIIHAMTTLAMEVL